MTCVRSFVWFLSFIDFFKLCTSRCGHAVIVPGECIRAVWRMSGVWPHSSWTSISLGMFAHTARVMPTPGSCLSTSWGTPVRCSPTEASLGCNVPGDGRFDPPRPQCMQPPAKQKTTRWRSSIPWTLYARRRRVDFRAAGGATRRPTRMENGSTSGA